MHQTFETLSDTDLLARMLRGEDRAWREFHRRFDRLVWMQIHRVTGSFAKVLSSADQEEIHANYYASLLSNDMHKLRCYDPNRGARLGTWITLLVGHCCHDYLRAVSRRPAGANLAALENILHVEEDLFEKTAARLSCERLAETLGEMSERDQTMVKMLFVDESSPNEIAEVCAIPVKTVYTRCHRLRVALKKQRDDGALAA
ncbi:MAG: sigma-70 family RNA polymerase sigma factor [Myxococcales bacterium]|nr:sigma-70 family RNA polymerase sigma factor [Myxococcales bacterium]